MPSLQARSAHDFGPATAGTRKGLLKHPEHAPRKTAPDPKITVGVPACRLGSFVAPFRHFRWPKPRRCGSQPPFNLPPCLEPPFQLFGTQKALRRVHRQMCSNARQMCSNARQMSPHARQMCSKARQMCSNARQVCSNARQMCSNARQMCSNAREMCSNARPMCSKAREMCLNARQMCSNVCSLSYYPCTAFQHNALRALELD